MSGKRWTIIVLLMGYAALGHFNRVGISVAGSEVFIPKLGITPVRMGWVYTAFLIVYTIGMLPGGWLIDRIGSARALTWFGFTMGIFVVLTGTLGWVTSTPGSLWLCLLFIRGLGGLCNAPLHPGAAHVVSDVMPPHRRASANGMVTAGALIGIALCFPVFGWLLDALTWQWAFVVCGSALIAYSGLWRWLASPSLPHPRPDKSDFPKKRPPVEWSMFLQKNLWLLTLSYAAYGYFQYLFFYWMDYYFKEILEIPKADGRIALFWIMLSQGAGMAIGGLSTDAVCKMLGTSHGRRAIVMVGMGMAAVFGLLAVNVSGFAPIAVCLALSMGSIGMVEGVFWTTATDLGGKSPGLAGAFMNTGGNIGGLISPVLTPIMAGRIGWSGAIVVACMISAFGGLVWFLIQLPQAEKHPEWDGPER